MRTASLHSLLQSEDVKVVLTDYFDSIVHRVVHPNYTLRLWSKILIRELGLKCSVDSLYFIRRESSLYLKRKLGLSEIEIPYDELKKEVFLRVVNSLLIGSEHEERFMKYFELADIRSELSVQFLNHDIVDLLRSAKEKGQKIYIVSDFYAAVEVFDRFLKHHGIREIFDGIYSSASSGASKQNTSIYDHIIEDLGITPENILMIGDNKKSDFKNALAKGLQAFRLPHNKFLFRNKLYLLGNDKKKYDKVVGKTYKACNSSESPPFSDYIIFFQVFVERLYVIARRMEIQNLFFASREGRFLKRLFDYYQDQAMLGPEARIGTHYLRMSRQAALQITYDRLSREKFSYLRKRFKDMSPGEFIRNFAFDNETTVKIQLELGEIDPEITIKGFFDSDEFETLVRLDSFKNAYEKNRKRQKNAFLSYLSSFEADITGGINIVDVGWGGTMQEAIYEVLNKKIPVTGYYLGLREVYNIQDKTKRYGLLFSIQPYEVYSDHILTANTQLYEQLLTADHGSTIGYDSGSENYTIENYTEEEKSLYQNYLRGHQDFMMEKFKILLKDLETICYDYRIVQRKITDLALRNGLLINSKKLGFIKILNRGFIQNIGPVTIGIEYDPSAAGSYRQLLKDLLVKPESKFRYLAKLKPMLYERNKVLAFLLPMWLIYWYFLLNRYFRQRIFRHIFFLRYNYFR